MPDDPTERLAIGRATLGRSIRAARHQQHLTLEQLAALSGFNKASLSALERGREMVSLPGLDRIATALNTTVVALLTETFPWDDVERPPALDAAPDGRAHRVD